MWLARDGLRMKIARAGGFTLIEMMVALVVLAVLLAVAAPGFYELIKNNRMLSEVYGLRAALNGARSEALAQRTVVTLCRHDDADDKPCEGDECKCKGDGWNKGYIAFADADGNGEADDPNNPQVFVAKLIDADTLSITYSRGDATDPKDHIVRFDSQGYAREFSGIFTFCDIRGVTAARRLEVTPVGVVRALGSNDPPAFTCP